VEACRIDNRKKEIAEFCFDVGALAGSDSFFNFIGLFAYFGPDVVLVFPIETYICGFFLNAVGFYQGGECCRNTGEHRTVASFFF